MRARRLRAAVTAVVLWMAGAAAAAGDRAAPNPCVWVGPGSELGSVIEALPEGGAACLGSGEHAGPLRITRRITVWGPPDAVVRSQGVGSTIRVEADGAALLGFSVDGSGGRFDLLDAAVRIHADDVRVEGLRIHDALFGILAEQSSRVCLRGNEIRGRAETALGMRGDAIRIWEVRGSEIVENRVADGRDVVVWYSPGNRIAGNTVERGRYGLHLMYSHQNAIVGNRLVANVVGVFLMYSRDVELRANLVAQSRGAAGVGLGSKESGNLRVLENAFVANTIGVYLDTSPLDPADRNRFEGNSFRFSEAAVVFHGRATGNLFSGNRFRDNGIPVRSEGRGDARDASWRGNEYDDYAGYDLDEDGVGDLPYELRSFSSSWIKRRPALAFFRGSPALGLVELVARALPLFRTTLLLVDPAPRMHLPDPPVLVERS